MKNVIKETLMNIGKILKIEGYSYEVEEKENRFTLSINEVMRDVGLSAGNSVVDLYYEVETKTIFIGMFRLPKKIRGRKISTKIIDFFKELTHKEHITLMANACDGYEFYWKKQGFAFVHFDSFGFEIMVFTFNEEHPSEKWKQFKETDVFKKHLHIHA